MATTAIGILQIVDGGLNNISNILDRLKTWPLNRPTDTFTGNRSTLNTEFTHTA